MTSSNALETTSQQLDPDLARWLERAEALAVGYESFTAAASTPGNPSGAAILPIASGGFACGLAAVDNAFFNRAVGIGTDETATEDDIEATSRFFVDLGVTESMAYLAPAVEEEAAGWLEKRGYRRGRRWVKMWRELDVELPEPVTSLRIERIDRSRAGDFVSVVLEGFGMPPEVAPIAGETIGRPGWSHYLGYDGEAPVSVAAMYVVEGVAWLGYGATLEAARGRGGQSAMFATRLADALDQGCRWAITETGEETEENPVNHSYRNMLRAGFHLAYARRNWVRVPDRA